LSKFKIEDSPTFTANVVIDRAGGGKIEVPFVFKYFAQDELYVMQEEWQKRRETASEEVKGRNLSIAELAGMRSELEAGELIEIVESWEFSDAVAEDSMRKFVNAISTNYQNAMEAFTKGLNPARSGN